MKQKLLLLFPLFILLIAGLFALARTHQAPHTVQAQASLSTQQSFLNISGIEGESSDDKHKGEIEINSFSTSVVGQSAANTSQGGTGKTNFSDIKFTTNVNKSSPKLFQAVTTGEHIPEVILTTRKAGGNQQEYLTITLKDVVVTQYDLSMSDEGPMDSFSLNFSQIYYQYSPQKPDGTLDSPVKAGYDLKKNEKI